MNAEYKASQLENARKELAAAKANMENLRGKRGFVQAAEAVEFWVAKVSFFSCIRCK